MSSKPSNRTIPYRHPKQIPGEYSTINDARNIKNGQVYYRRLTDSPIGYHFGIGYIDPETRKHFIIDLSSGRIENGVEYPVQIIDFRDFWQGETVYIFDESGKKCRRTDQVIRVALRFVGRKGSYGTFSYNCGMFAFYCKLTKYKSIHDVPWDIGQEMGLKTVING